MSFAGHALYAVPSSCNGFVLGPADAWMPIALYFDTSPSLSPDTVVIVATPVRSLPGNGSPDSVTSMHFSSPMKPLSGGTLPGSSPDPSDPNPSVGSKRRPVLTDQCVGWSLVSQMLKSVSCQEGLQLALGTEHGRPAV